MLLRRAAAAAALVFGAVGPTTVHADNQAAADPTMPLFTGTSVDESMSVAVCEELASTIGDAFSVDLPAGDFETVFYEGVPMWLCQFGDRNSAWVKVGWSADVIDGALDREISSFEASGDEHEEIDGVGTRAIVGHRAGDGGLGFFGEDEDTFGFVSVTAVTFQELDDAAVLAAITQIGRALLGRERGPEPAVTPEACEALAPTVSEAFGIDLHYVPDSARSQTTFGVTFRECKFADADHPYKVTTVVSDGAVPNGVDQDISQALGTEIIDFEREIDGWAFVECCANGIALKASNDDTFVSLLLVGRGLESEVLRAGAIEIAGVLIES
jgi:hypothetical protein